ncbi:MAG: sulfotransferase [Planctomycetota bacterium]
MHPNHIIIVGAQKCGTTTLYRWLASHPEVSAASIDPIVGSRKELKFFAGPNWQRGLDWYSNLFPDPTTAGIDASPQYLAAPAAAGRIAKTFPDAKVIVTIRDPVRRAISQYNHYSRKYPDTSHWDWRCPGGTLAENLERELKEPFGRWRGLLGRGLYAPQLSHLSQHIASNRLCLLVLEEWMLSPREAYRTLMDFLGLEPQKSVKLRAFHRRKKAGAPVDDRTEGLLRDFYRHPNEELFNWMGREIGSWSLGYDDGRASRDAPVVAAS